LICIITSDYIVGPAETPYMVFEYMLHGDLADLLRKNDTAMRAHDNHITLEKVVYCCNIHSLYIFVLVCK